MDSAQLEFRMHGIRSLIELMDAPQIKLLVDDLEQAANRNPGAAIDHAKALVECVCKTILKERGQTIENNPDLPRLFSLTTNSMQLVPNSRGSHSETIKALSKMVSGLHKAVGGLGELRNQEGTVSHGKDAQLHPLDYVQAQLAARAADTVVNFLYSAHKIYPLDLSVAFLRYEDQKAFNEFVDDVNSVVEIFHFKYPPSKALFCTDEDAYREALIEYINDYGTDRAAENE